MKFFSILLFAVIANAETKASIANVKTTPGEARVWVALPSGRMAEAKLEGAIVLDTSGSSPVLRVSLPVLSAPMFLPSQKQTTVVTAAAQIGFQTAFPIDECYWNGMLMSEGEDYSLSLDKKTLTFLAGTPGAGDIVIFKSAATSRPAATSSR